jgi:hypothetical protein
MSAEHCPIPGCTRAHSPTGHHYRAPRPSPERDQTVALLVAQLLEAMDRRELAERELARCTAAVQETYIELRRQVTLAAVEMVDDGLRRNDERRRGIEHDGEI